MKKLVAITLAAVMSLSSLAALAGCGGDKDNGDNTDPVIEGVKAEDTVFAGEEWDALAGVTASDEEDGDLTSKIEVSAVGLTFTNGKTTPTVADAIGYEIVYTVTDSDGGEATEYCTLHVNEAAGELVNVYTADFSDITPDYDWTDGHDGDEGNNHWWNLVKGNDAEATATLKEGRLEVDVTNRNNAADYQLMLRRTFADLAVGKYKFVVWAKSPSTETVKLNMIAELDTESSASEDFNERNLGRGKYNLELTSQYQVFALDFELTQAKLKNNANQGKVHFRIGLGGDYNPNAFKVDIEKIIIWKTTGSNTETNLYVLDATSSTGGLVIDHANDGSTAAVAYDATEQAVKIDITQYNTSGGGWSIVAKAPLTGAKLEVGKRYGVEVAMKADTAIKPVIIIGRNGDDGDGRNSQPRGFVGGDNADDVSNAFVTVEGKFDGFATNTPYIFFELGKATSNNATTNVIYIKSIRLYEVEQVESTTNRCAITPSSDTVGLEIHHTWDEAAATVAYDADEQAAKIDITKYNPTEGGVWSIVVKAPLTGAKIEANKRYGVEVEMKANTGFTPEFVIGRNGEEDGRNNDPRYVKNDTPIGDDYTIIAGKFETKDGLSTFATETPYIFFQLGKKLGDNPSPAVDANVIYIKSIRFYEIVDGTEKTAISTMNAADCNAPKVNITKMADGAEDGVTVSTVEGKTQININKYNTSQGSWSIIATIPLKGVKLDKTKKYGYAITIKATNAFDNAEIHCGPESNSDEGDKWYSAGIGEIGTEFRTLYYTFTPAAACDTPALHLFIGKKPENTATSNTITIESIRFFEVEGNEETSKFQDKFILFGDASPDKTNEKYPISVYNQSDDVWDAAPTGTAYFENNKLVYLIHHGGSDQGHNKLAFGFWDNYIALPANAYYVVSFKIKASVDLDFALALHDIDMDWNEANGGVMIRYCDFGGHELLHAGTQEKTIEVMSSSPSLVARNCELLLEFGKFLGNNTEVKIEISDLKIGYRSIQA